MIAPILKTLVTIYGSPDVDDPKTWFEEVSKLLVDYSSDVQEKAAQRIFRTHRTRSFPHISDIIGACSEIAAFKAPPPKRAYGANDPQWSDESFKAADQLIDCDLGREAARDGWGLGLHEFLRLKRRLPNQYEQRAIIDNSNFVSRCAVGTEDMGALHGALMTLAQSVVARREALANRILDGVVSRRITGEHQQ